MPLFVWVRDFANRPRPQLWPEDLPHEERRVVVKHVVKPEDEGLPFDVLARLYPAPVRKEASS